MKYITAALLLFFCAQAFAIEPQFWEENTQQSFADGDPQSVSITSDGELLLAPQLKKIYEGSDSIIWKIIRDSKGNLYAGTGSDGKIIKIDTAGKASTLLDTSELEVQALVVDGQDNVFAATSPDGKIYEIKPDGTPKVFFDPDDKYIWSLALDEAGNLYAGTGDAGKIYKIDKAGNGKVLIDTNETNITVLAWDKQKNLLAGSDRNGILYRIDPSGSGKAFVLFDSDLQQITSIYCDADGAVYFAAITGVPSAPQIKPPQEPSRTVTVLTAPETGTEGNEEGEVTTTVEVIPSQPAQIAAPARPAGASQLYRLQPDGVTEVVYTALEDQILDISSYKDGMILLSTGKKAKLILLDKNKKSTILLKVPEEQITSLLQDQRIWIATANPGNIYQLAEDHSSKGTYFSDVKDTQTISTWGRINWKVAAPAGTSVIPSTRSGNTRAPDNTWSPWKSAGSSAEGQEMGVPKARFVQWKADFSTSDPKETPVLKSVRIAYLQQNIRPEILSVTVHPPGVVYHRAVFPQDSFAGVEDSASSNKDQQENQQSVQPGFDQAALGKQELRKGFETITWVASDQNQDDLRFNIYYKSVGDKSWKELAKDLKEKVFAWDTQTMPDGTYAVMVEADDNPSNPKEYVLSSSKESGPFDVDNSAPKIEVLKSSVENGILTLEVRAQDQFSPIKEMEYSIKPGKWEIVFPIDSINDSPSETYRIELKERPENTTEITLKCSDAINNTTAIQYKFPR